MINTNNLKNINWNEIDRQHKKMNKFAKHHVNRILHLSEELLPSVKQRVANQASALANEEGFWASQSALHNNAKIHFAFNTLYPKYYVICLGAEAQDSKSCDMLNKIYEFHNLIKQNLNDESTLVEEASQTNSNTDEVAETSH